MQNDCTYFQWRLLVLSFKSWSSVGAKNMSRYEKEEKCEKSKNMYVVSDFQTIQGKSIRRSCGNADALTSKAHRTEYTTQFLPTLALYSLPGAGFLAGVSFPSGLWIPLPPAVIKNHQSIKNFCRHALLFLIKSWGFVNYIFVFNTNNKIMIYKTIIIYDLAHLSTLLLPILKLSNWKWDSVFHINMNIINLHYKKTNNTALVQ